MKNHLPVLEELQNCTQAIQYAIYGPVKDAEYWEKCKAQIKRLPSNVTVQYQGEISPHKVESVLATAHVFILPSKSENFGHAIYEALIGGKPVITSHRTPWNGLKDAKAGINASPETSNDLKQAIEFFAQMTSAEFSEWSFGATNYAKKMIDIETIKVQYKKMFFAEGCNKEQQSSVAIKCLA